MGFFSWLTADTNESMVSHYHTKSEMLGPSKEKLMYLLTPDGNKYTIITYDGYGRVIIRLDGQIRPDTMMGRAIVHTEEPALPLWELSKKDGMYDYWVDLHCLMYTQNFEKDGKVDSEAIRLTGIKLALRNCFHNQKPLKIVRNPDVNYDEIPPSPICPNQGFFL